MSADKSGVEGGGINSRRSARGVWGGVGRTGMAFGGVGSALERRSAYIYKGPRYRTTTLCCKFEIFD